MGHVSEVSLEPWCLQCVSPRSHLEIPREPCLTTALTGSPGLPFWGPSPLPPSSPGSHLVFQFTRISLRLIYSMKTFTKTLPRTHSSVHPSILRPSIHLTGECKLLPPEPEGRGFICFLNCCVPRTQNGTWHTSCSISVG